jgi:thiol-disulfide isomerase/thioredoxin
LNRRNTTEKSRSTGEGEARPAKPKPDEVACRYDPVENRIVDFQFKDVSGRDVRLQDFDADLILLDFWGTWCSPCRDAIPHLVELQKRYGAKHLRVIGIAYEQAPAERRASLVSDTGRKLNVNYPLLIGPTETPCPLREALHVQVYPTMVLLDREGRVLWRQEGNTAQVMARLGRKIDIALKEGVSDETTRR